MTTVLICPVIQGTADTNAKLTPAEISKTVDFCLRAFQPTDPEARDAVLQKLEGINLNETSTVDARTKGNAQKLETNLSEDELGILNSIRARQMLRSEDTLNIDNFGADAIDGMRPNLTRGELGLVKPKADDEKPPETDVLSLMIGEKQVVEQMKAQNQAQGVSQESTPIAAH